ncbi:MFS transporter [Amnibacterium kyonggiense]
MLLSHDLPPPAASAAAPSSKRWWTLAVVALAQLMVVLDATVVNIALPSAQADLGFSNADRQWVVTAYSLAFGSLLLLGGRLGDLVGRKRMFLIGLVGFALASALGGAAPTFGVLIAARALQGVFGAMLAPTALAVLTTTFTIPKERARAFGVFGALAGAGGAIGLLLGGLLTQSLDWRWNLYINDVIAVVAVIGAVLLVPSVQRQGPRPRLDVPGTLLVSGGLFSLVFGFSNAESDGWGSPPAGRSSPRRACCSSSSCSGRPGRRTRCSRS